MKQIRRLFFDLETKANPENLALAPEPQVSAPSNYKDPEKIARYIADAIETKKQELIDRAALDPDYGMIKSVGICLEHPGEDKIFTRLVGEPNPTYLKIAQQAAKVQAEKRAEILAADPDAEIPPLTEEEQKELDVPPLTESDIITSFWNVFSEVRGYCVGFNILSFDLPYLLARSMYLGIKVPFVPALARYRIEPVTDLYAIRYNWGPGKGLKTMVKLLGIKNDLPEVDGSQVATMTDEELRTYQENDIKLLIAVYDRMNGVYFNL